MKAIASARVRLAAALLLPLVVLAYSWVATCRIARQGQEWLIPVTGYDPRDLLRGHYVRYRYEWPVDRLPTNSANGGTASLHPSSALCIEGTPPDIVRVRELPAGMDRRDSGEAKGCAAIARASVGSRREIRGLESGILFTSQSRALLLSRQLADPGNQGFVRVRIGPDGFMRPIDLELRRRKGD
ncbi:GDYXXLXY domain-containing protein [Sphingobium estronivorans]|uniref:GDYXXLXY domain-containing protein n=1 Tax=Sphingobium estronivorans TaxID=1577690 RepID=UPI001238D16C|nr:GDYXXLXY domain-containing protein [Sphingobium estronivorans]